MSLPTVQKLIGAAINELRSSSPTARLDAELLLAHVLGWSRARLLAERQYVPDEEQRAAFTALVARRAALEPVAYLVGHKEFYGLDFLVDRRVLVPRPETELLVERALVLADDMSRRRNAEAQPGHHSHLRVADIGTGSGCIAVTLAVHLPASRILAVDVSPDALAVAATNVTRHNVDERVTLLQGDLLAPLVERVDMLVSNPPYTILAEIDPGVLRHEPHLALDGGLAGLEVYERLLSQAPQKLSSDGILLLEIGAWQGAALTALAQQTFPGTRVTLHQDLAGRDRVLEVDRRQ